MNGRTAGSEYQGGSIAGVGERWEMDFSHPMEDTLLLRVSGDWRLENGLPSAVEVNRKLESDRAIQRIMFDTEGLTGWDSGLVNFLLGVINACQSKGLDADKSGLPQGVQRLIDLATAVPEKKGARREAQREAVLSQIGTTTIETFGSATEMFRFIGDACIAFLNLLRGKARFRLSDLTLTIQECGIQALPIVSLISFLIGLILAFVGAVQLQQFGAGIYVADLVGIGMAREMGAMMTAIIMAGRTGAAFAAQLGTMTVNEEVDAFKTLGFSPMEFLVLPRMLALALMMPLLCLYADLVGMLGGAIVGIGMLDLSLAQYLDQTQGAVGLTDLSVGLVKSIVFGILVALSGCLRGMQCGRSSAAVGIAATSAVVTAIVFIIVTDAIFAVVTNIIGV
ncbi:MAG: ABC transporter permease [Phycisphaerales bacterium]|nr:MAG: ABC transporter permease [Phycisphaerales bacterium]